MLLKIQCELIMQTVEERGLRWLAIKVEDVQEQAVRETACSTKTAVAVARKQSSLKEEEWKSNWLSGCEEIVRLVHNVAVCVGATWGRRLFLQCLLHFDCSWAMMTSCWQEKPFKRPVFGTLAAELEKQLGCFQAYALIWVSKKAICMLYSRLFKHVIACTCCVSNLKIKDISKWASSTP